MPGLIRDVVPDATRSVDHLGPTVYVAAGSAGVVIVNASDPAAPAVVRTVATGTFDRRLDVDEAGARLAVASGSYSTNTGAVTCFSLANPAQPVRTVRYSSPSVAEDVAWAADRSGQTRLYAAVTSDGVVVLDAGAGRVAGSYDFLRDVAPGANRIVSVPSGAGRAVAAGVYVARVSGGAVWPPAPGTPTGGGVRLAGGHTSLTRWRRALRPVPA